MKEDINIPVKKIEEQMAIKFADFIASHSWFYYSGTKKWTSKIQQGEYTTKELYHFYLLN